MKRHIPGLHGESHNCEFRLSTLNTVPHKQPIKIGCADVLFSRPWNMASDG